MSWIVDLIPFAPFVMIIFVVWFIAVTHRARDRQRAEMQKDLLAKFSSAQELSEFLQTDGSKLLMPSPEKARTPANRAGTGILVFVVGLGLFAGSQFMRNADEVGSIRLGGLLAIAAGIGLLLSAYVSHKLSRKWDQKDSPAQ